MGRARRSSTIVLVVHSSNNVVVAVVLSSLVVVLSSTSACTGTTTQGKCDQCLRGSPDVKLLRLRSNVLGAILLLLFAGPRSAMSLVALLCAATSAVICIMGTLLKPSQ